VNASLVKDSWAVLPDSYHREILIEERMTADVEEFLKSHDFEFVNALSSLRVCFTRSQPPYPESCYGHPVADGYLAIAEAAAPAAESQALNREAGQVRKRCEWVRNNTTRTRRHEETLRHAVPRSQTVTKIHLNGYRIYGHDR
jgi:hypothetical protein